MNKAFEKILERLEELKLPFPDNCPSYHGNTDDLIDMTKDIVKKVEEEYNNGWIPCSERLPRNYTDVLADVRGIGFDSSKDAEMVGHFSENGKWFYSHGMQYIVDGEKTKVIAWQPLPEPYKEEKNA